MSDRIVSAPVITPSALLDSAPRVSSYVELMRWRAEQTPEQRAYIYLERGETPSAEHCYRTLDVEARRLATILQSLGATGQRVLLLLPSDLDYVVSFFACLYAGAVAVTLDASTRPKHLERLRSIARDAEPTVVISTAATRAAIAPLDDQALAHATWLDIESLPTADPDAWRPPNLRGDTLALLQYTSGSIADPKGVMITHENLLFQGRYLERLLGFTQTDVAVTWLPHFHDMGLILGILQASYTGFPCYLMSPMAFIKRPMCWLEAISRFRGTYSPAPNFAYDLCIRSFDPNANRVALDLSSWKVALNGAEPVRKSTLDGFCATFGPHGFSEQAFCVGYGMAEATLAISTTTRSRAPRSIRAQTDALLADRVLAAEPGEDGRELVSCGRTELGSEVVIASRELVPLPANTVGEIFVAGGSRASGYWRRPEQTRATFDVVLADGRGPYLRTGDLGFIDEAGELHVAGRDKDLLIINGKNHWPQDLEFTAESCHAAVRPHFVAAFSVELDGRERAVLVAELLPGAEAEPGRVAAAIRTAIAREHDIRLAEIVFVEKEQFPKTTSGKLQRRRCRALYLDNRLLVRGRFA